MKKTKAPSSLKKAPYLEKIGQLIAKKRKSALLSQEQLGLEIGLDQSYIGKVERGEANPTVETLLKIAGTLKCKVSDFTPFP